MKLKKGTSRINSVFRAAKAYKFTITTWKLRDLTFWALNMKIKWLDVWSMMNSKTFTRWQSQGLWSCLINLALLNRRNYHLAFTYLAWSPNRFILGFKSASLNFFTLHIQWCSSNSTISEKHKLCAFKNCGSIVCCISFFTYFNRWYYFFKETELYRYLCTIGS